MKTVIEFRCIAVIDDGISPVESIFTDGLPLCTTLDFEVFFGIIGQETITHFVTGCVPFLYCLVSVHRRIHASGNDFVTGPELNRGRQPRGKMF